MKTNSEVVKHYSRQQTVLAAVFIILGVLLIARGSWGMLISRNYVMASNQSSSNRWPTVINMGTAGNMTMNGKTMYMGPGTPITSLQDPQTAIHVDTFTLTAQVAHLSLGKDVSVTAWTFNGTSPGPTLRVRQGDLVVVHLVNHLPFSVTIHWHGVTVPNSADGVAGLTQDAVKPDQTYTYHFLARESGTYWYHSHQESYDETTHGLYGLFIVYPSTPLVHDDVDETVDLHNWPSGNGILTMNGTTGVFHIPAQPGQRVRLRITNTDFLQRWVILTGVSFTVAALDGHDLNGPQPLSATMLPIGAAQRYDLRFQMPRNGPVQLFTVGDNGRPQLGPVVVVGQGNTPSTLPPISQKFDFSTYGHPRPDAITLQRHFDATYSITLNNHVGTFNGHMGMVYTLNGKSFPDTAPIEVKLGQLVKFHIVNESGEIHAMHLHGHTFAVLTRNGHQLTGSPVYLDTVDIQPHETYDIAFFANNPGLWMFHCHNLFHAYWGMDMMVVYPGISTPYSIGSASGNFPD